MTRNAWELLREHEGAFQERPEHAAAAPPTAPPRRLAAPRAWLPPVEDLRDAQRIYEAGEALR
jgi:hypothetical protein